MENINKKRMMKAVWIIVAVIIVICGISFLSKNSRQSKIDMETLRQENEGARQVDQGTLDGLEKEIRSLDFSDLGNGVDKLK